MCVLVLNMGLKSIRSIIFDEKGNKLAFSNLSIETKIKGSNVTQSPEEWWEKALIVMKATIEEASIKNSVKYITVTSSSACLVPVSRDCEPQYDCIMVSDTRAVSESLLLAEMTEFQKVSETVGLSSAPSLMLPKIMWLKNNVPTVFERAYKFLAPNDFFIGKLSGRFITDEFNAQKYHYDTSMKKYPETLLKKLEISLEQLPEVVTPGEIAGKLTDAIKRELGFHQDVQVVISSYDAICAFIGSGPQSEYEACDVSGTVTSVRAFSRKLVVEHNKRILNTPFKSIGMNIVGGSNNLGGGLIEWVKQCYYIKEQYPYEVMEMEARQSTEGANGLIFLPYLMGERAPLWDIDARGVYFGIERTHTRKDMTRAVFESAGYTTRNLIEVMHENEMPISRIRLSGGLARINLVSQIKADITGMEVVVVDEFETTALGAAIIVGLGMGTYSTIFEATSSCVRDRMIILPNSQKNAIYNEMYGLFKESYESLKELFKKRNSILKHIYSERQEKIENL